MFSCLHTSELLVLGLWDSDQDLRHQTPLSAFYIWICIKLILQLTGLWTWTELYHHLSCLSSLPTTNLRTSQLLKLYKPILIMNLLIYICIYSTDYIYWLIQWCNKLIKYCMSFPSSPPCPSLIIWISILKALRNSI